MGRCSTMLAMQECLPTTHQMLFFKAATGYAFTIFLAGFAFTMQTLPKISLWPAFVAGFVRVLKRHNAGIANKPFFFTSFVASSVMMLSILAQTFCLSSQPFAMALAMLLLDMALTAFVVAFMGLLVFGNMAGFKYAVN